ncbi:MAG: chromophore lyase CpcT/CpeT [Cyanobacteria bacterium SID2]|nr:chromophore lyase CpcT/CpeT [Cyanobacteria bacterium SID2]MBP0006738.1 chromophore lyase CpcT/CpeT [Cyanobacteria bacterium SBC]
MSTNSPLTTLARFLAGEFENDEQARNQPSWFVRLRLWNRPLPHNIDGHLALFAEQAPALKLHQPYRQRILLLQPGDVSPLRVEYRAFCEPEKFRGAGVNPSLLENVTTEDLENLPGCVLNVRECQETFIAEPPEGAKCCFDYDGKTRQVVLGFEVGARWLKSFDRGVDPETGRGLWGALMGAYEFQKLRDFELPER